MTILQKIEKAKLIGRGGACFPTASKWQMVKEAPDKEKYIVCNASEGEPGIKKDGYIFKHHPDKVIDGLKIALNVLKAKKAIIFIRKDYYKKYGRKLKKLSRGLPIEFFVKDKSWGYIAGEESSLLNAIEGRKPEPRLRPPFPVTNGLWNKPTLINNVETFFNVSLVNSGQYEEKRFYTINGDCPNTGVFFLPAKWSIKKVLQETNNAPKFKFFVQVGGNASGVVYNDSQLNKNVTGSGSITVYQKSKYGSRQLMHYWLSFYRGQSCGQCTPCREGTYRLAQIMESKSPDWNLFFEILNALDETSICGLGKSISTPIKSYLHNILFKETEYEKNICKNKR